MSKADEWCYNEELKTSANILEHSIDVADENEIDVTTINEINDDELPDENTADTFLENWHFYLY